MSARLPYNSFQDYNTGLLFGPLLDVPDGHKLQELKSVSAAQNYVLLYHFHYFFTREQRTNLPFFSLSSGFELSNYQDKRVFIGK